MNVQVLDGWTVCGFDSYVPFKGVSMELGQELKGITPWMPVDVPGGIYTTLLREGLIEDPFLEMNSLKCEWVAERWWVYRTVFRVDFPLPERLELVFEGLDYKAHIFLNGERLATHVGMFTKCVLDVTDRVREKNLLQVVFENAPEEMGQVGLTCKTTTQKARNNYKWDFCVRMINLGLYAPVYLQTSGAVKIEGCHFRTRNRLDGTADVVLELDALREGDYTVRCRLGRNGGTEAEVCCTARLRRGKNRVAQRLRVPHVQVWYPNGSGGQPLYDLTAEVLEAGVILDERRERVGFKSLRLAVNAGAPPDSLPYTFVINGEPTFVKGVNITPLDMEYGTVTEERYRSFLTAMRDMNVNLIRVWGGGLIESPIFYDLCDELGLLVWQDFILSSSGIDNYPPSDAGFLRLLSATAEEATRSRRDHVSLAVWCGGNELMYPESARPIDDTVPAVARLKRIVKRNCPDIPMLPTTPSGPVFSFDQDPAKNHDVHGPWTYGGVREHYRLYNESRYLFHSEFGCDGLAVPDTCRRIMRPENVGAFDMDDNIVWRFRGEWWNVYKRDSAIFGGAFASYEDFAAASQFVQAEGLRYAVEAARRQYPYCAGSVVWQGNEPFPNIACTSLVDYYGRKKPAYEAVRRAYRRVHPSLRYDSLVCRPGEPLRFTAFVTSEEAEQTLTLWLGVEADGLLVLEDERTVTVGGGRTAEAGRFSLAVPDCGGLLVRLRVMDGGAAYENEVLFLVEGASGISLEPVRALWAQRQIKG